MGLEDRALAVTDDFPIEHERDVHSGKVRSVYWLMPGKSQQLAVKRGYNIDLESQLGVMIISDRISAFDVNWKGEDGLNGVPGKGVALNAISQYWFEQFRKEGLGDNHVLESPHPLVWIVQKAKPIMIELIARQYITGSMWRAYSKGERTFCGIELPEGLRQNQKLNTLLLTPTTKGLFKGILGVKEKDDADISKLRIMDNYNTFGFRYPEDVDECGVLLEDGFKLIERELAKAGQIFVDTKFEFGYVKPKGKNNNKIIYIDEAGTPDSSRMWDSDAYARGEVIENSKEGFRRFLMRMFGKEVFTGENTMPERKVIANHYRVPIDVMLGVSDTYTKMAEKITGKPLPRVENAREEIMQVMSQYGLAA